MEERPFEVFAVKLRIDSGNQYLLPLALSRHGIPVFTADAQPLSAKIGDALIFINEDNLMNTSLFVIHRKLAKYGKVGKVVTFTIVSQESLHHPSMADFNRVRAKIVFN